MYSCELLLIGIDSEGCDSSYGAVDLKEDDACRKVKAVSRVEVHLLSWP
jgi:hypothetical protein